MMSLCLMMMTTLPVEWVGTPPRRVDRLATLAPSLSETVLSLGEGNRLVGVSRFDEAPALAGLPRVGGFSDPSIEAILAVKPDLVLAQKNGRNQATLKRLSQLGIPVLTFSLTTMADTVAAIEAIAGLLGRRDEGARLVRDIREARDTWRRRGRAGAPQRVLVVLGFSPLVVAGPRSFAGELLTDCGATNAAASATVPYPVWSMERVAASPPEIVIDATDVPNGRERVEQLSGKARWVRLTDLSLLQPGPALARALDELCGTLASPSTSTRETP